MNKKRLILKFNILILNFFFKQMKNYCLLNLMNWKDLLEFMIGLDLEHYLVLKNMMLITIESDILSFKKVVLPMYFSELCKI